uniref:Uncharacterized protein n=1 Tax=Anguilla anguilla TaxID=7936 RepID=A0A0E9RXW6_ANGAN
MGRYACSLL